MPANLAFLIDAAEPERAARLRELRVLALVYCGPAHPVAKAMAAAVMDPAAADAALAEIGRLPALCRRRLLSTFAAIVFPSPEPRRKRHADT
jgi:hypothetical protein